MTKKKKIDQFSFYFDSNSCSGCKACQMACKDKNDLNLGVLWRRVYDITGGDWVKEKQSWQHQIFSYNLSISCNHCKEPICLNACPTKAIQKKENGVVIIEEKKCIGCKYCSWACPYGAPQYDQNSGTMTKCDFCNDLLEKDEQPVCVSACPMRVLDFGEYSELFNKYRSGNNIYPLPSEEITKPAIVVNPHKNSKGTDRDNSEISNAEEV